MKITVRVEAMNLFKRLKNVEDTAHAGIKAAVREGAKKMHGHVMESLSRPATGKGKYKNRSRPGEPARSDSGRFKRHTILKFSPKGWVGYVTTTDGAADKKGRRYPWMLEAGTKTIAKRPTFRKAFRKTRPSFVRALVEAWRRAVR